MNMVPSAKSVDCPSASTNIRNVFASHRPAILLGAVAFMALFAFPWLALNLAKLLWAEGPWGAVDLKYRYDEVQLWFVGASIYREQANAIHAIYPPASYAILWPLMGWLEFSHARIVSAVTLTAALTWLAFLFVKESGAQTRLERLFVVFLLLSMYATGFSIGHGQLTLYTICGLLAGLTLLSRGQRRWQDDLLAAALILVALVKPTLSVPFFWLVLFRPSTLRPAVFAVAGYLALTLVAVAFQDFDFAELIRSWLSRSIDGAARESVGGYGNIHSWLAVFGLRQWNTPASLLLLLALGYWTYRNRSEDLWLLLGVTAIVARIWVYHRSYDDILVLLPMIALFRIAKYGSSKDGYDVMAGILLAIALLMMFVPALLLVFPASKSLLKNSQSLIPIMLLMFLLYWGWRTGCEKSLL